jgi:hypothetical protein
MLCVWDEEKENLRRRKPENSGINNEMLVFSPLLNANILTSNDPVRSNVAESGADDDKNILEW